MSNLVITDDYSNLLLHVLGGWEQCDSLGGLVWGWELHEGGDVPNAGQGGQHGLGHRDHVPHPTTPVLKTPPLPNLPAPTHSSSSQLS